MVVPDVVGLAFEDARLVAFSASVALAQPDADGPPVSALAWKKNLTVVGQEPAAGASVFEWDSVVVWFDDPEPSTSENDDGQPSSSRGPGRRTPARPW
ncbi:hypothetical protein [Subtercola vilae]|uniref:PASTA domain-containing protein n=1 Tax=Subtercola vilae TaxID=2056433 RepID=A0A4T2C8B4_9MICO|nr:hypothetical protein [Subtercola vilae]TIH40695.1 hypothetical protein D4765_01555 [Subtercola vilae]